MYYNVMEDAKEIIRKQCLDYLGWTLPLGSKGH
jgi:hypothetical protein